MKLYKKIFLLFSGAMILSSAQGDTINIWMVGDSTMAKKNKSHYPESGWGEGIKEFVTGNAKVHNHAASGRSTLSFINEGRWKNVTDSIKPGDYVIIQFGHNDEKPNPKIHTDAFGSFKENLKKFITETRYHKAFPIICSAIVRRHFDGSGKLKDTHGDYITAAKQVAAETNVPYIDMEANSRALISKMGPEKSKSLFTFTETKQDSTHLNVEGSKVVAKLFVDDAKKNKIPIAKLFKTK
jgi:lysophospholipase L1-like esterase